MHAVSLVLTWLKHPSSFAASCQRITIRYRCPVHWRVMMAQHRISQGSALPLSVLCYCLPTWLLQRVSFMRSVPTSLWHLQRTSTCMGSAHLNGFPRGGNVGCVMWWTGWALWNSSLKVRSWLLHALWAVGFPMADPTVFIVEHREVFVHDILLEQANSHTFWQRVCRINLDTHPSISTSNSRICDGIYF